MFFSDDALRVTVPAVRLTKNTARPGATEDTDGGL